MSTDPTDITNTWDVITIHDIPVSNDDQRARTADPFGAPRFVTITTPRGPNGVGVERYRVQTNNYAGSAVEVSVWRDAWVFVVSIDWTEDYETAAHYAVEAHHILHSVRYA